MEKFELVTEFEPQGDQPQAIEELVSALNHGDQYQTLLGVTGSGKTFTMANVIAQVNRPTLIFSHNKTLAAQLYGEMKSFFPKNAVEFFISYYDYYQPEAYIPSSDIYIEKDTAINDEIDRLRLKATSSLITRRDVIIVASVSCIYGLGSPLEFKRQLVSFKKGEVFDRQEMLGRLIDIHYTRNDFEFKRATFRVRGDIIEIFPAYEEHALRVELWGDEIEKITRINPLTGEILQELDQTAVYPAKHFVTTYPQLEKAMHLIKAELNDRLQTFRAQQKFLETQRIETRTLYDLEMMQEIGYCNGIENYSRHLSERSAGERPECLVDYFPDDFLLFVDESHVTIPQIRAMYNGDRARKETLVEHGFRLPSALDNRPLKFEEFEAITGQTIFVSATPSDYEIEKSDGIIVEQLIRPTGLMDPWVIVRPADGQIDDLIGEIKKRITNNERILVTTLTKRMSEDLCDYMTDMGLRVRYLHSEIDALDRVEILRGLRLADFDVLIGINLLREGLDLPEVSLVAIIDADKQGFLRSERSLLQTAGRAARNINGTVILYGDKTTKAMQHLIDETKRRRQLQKEYNTAHDIEPRSIYKSIENVKSATTVADAKVVPLVAEAQIKALSPMEKESYIDALTEEMHQASARLEFEKAVQLRDEISRLKGENIKKKTTFRYQRR
ncbi:excinuclease ABC subunit UvrB [bacterium]|nr:excinuclease ABC subunit UvrB [bacterium]